MKEITDRVINVSKVPVTAKTRLGWDSESKNVMDVALLLQDCGIHALTIHGRTRAQMYKGEADWTLIGEVKNNINIKIPIIGNGDITSGKMAFDYFEKYADRFPILHIKDRSVLGQSGMMNFENIFNAAYKNGLDEFYVELEGIRKGMTQFEGVKGCFDYLNNAKFVK
jgi:tRNA-dihydrouridine synthase